MLPLSALSPVSPQMCVPIVARATCVTSWHQCLLYDPSVPRVININVPSMTLVFPVLPFAAFVPSVSPVPVLPLSGATITSVTILGEGL